jgi:hypothetical protein
MQIPATAGRGLSWRKEVQDEITMAQRIETLAAGARIPLQQGAAARIANAVGGTVSRLRDAKLEVPLEIEPASFVVAQHTENEP